MILVDITGFNFFPWIYLPTIKYMFAVMIPFIKYINKCNTKRILTPVLFYPCEIHKNNSNLPYESSFSVILITK